MHDGVNTQFNLDDFNLNSEETSWEAPVRDPRNVGSKTIISVESPKTTVTPEALRFNSESPQPLTESKAPVLGQVVSLAPEIADPSATQPAFDRSGLKTTTKLDKRGVATVSKIISKFSRDGNVTDFYDAVRGEGGMMETNLAQSYGRTLGEQK